MFWGFDWTLESSHIVSLSKINWFSNILFENLHNFKLQTLNSESYIENNEFRFGSFRYSRQAGGK